MPHSEPQVVMMCGVAGSGKTHYARALEARGYTRLSADLLVWEHHAAELPSMPPESQRPLFREASRQIEVMLGEHIDRGEHVVLDATMCHRERRDAIRALCRKRGVEPQLVYMRASLPLLRERLAARSGCGPDDQIVQPEHLERFYAGFEPPGADEHPVVIDQG